MNDKIGIPNHAFIYVMLAKAISDRLPERKAEELIRDITVYYGRRRGERMRRNAERLGYGDGLSAWFLTSEWRGRENENRSLLERKKGEAVSEVQVCGWYETWKKYGLLQYGTRYCRFIDQAIAEGFHGRFTLTIPASKGRGAPVCRFVFREEGEAEAEMDAKENLVLPFSFHCRELLECAELVLLDEVPEQAAEILAEVKKEYRRIFPEEAFCFRDEAMDMHAE